MRWESSEGAPLCLAFQGNGTFSFIPACGLGARVLRNFPWLCLGVTPGDTEDPVGWGCGPELLQEYMHGLLSCAPLATLWHF